MKHALSRKPAFLALAAGWPLIAVILIPIVALSLSATPATILNASQTEDFRRALLLSATTSTCALLIVIAFGTPLAWGLACSRSRLIRIFELLAAAPIVLPPAVVGLALLLAFGRNGWLGNLGFRLSFTTAAVVVAQVVVSAPFYLQAATAAFRRVDDDMLLVARTLGHGPVATFFRVTLPIALPALGAGAAIAWARALGEFGATLIFAGNLPGRTQTMPLAIYGALESDINVAIALAIALACLSLGVLAAMRALPRWARWGYSRSKS